MHIRINRLSTYYSYITIAIIRSFVVLSIVSLSCTNYLTITIQHFTLVTLWKCRTRLQCIYLYRNCLTRSILQLDNIETSCTRTASITYLILLVSYLIETCRIITLYCIRNHDWVLIIISKLQIIVNHVRSIIIHIRIECVLVIVAEQAFISLQWILRILRLAPNATESINTMFFDPYMLQPVACITHPLMIEVAMIVPLPNIKMIAKHLFRIIELSLPLSTLLPESTTTGTVRTKTITESMMQILGSTFHVYLVSINLILERVTNFMTDSRTYWLASRRIYPKCTNLVVIARTSSKPFVLINQINLHLIVVKHRLTLTNLRHTQSFDIGIIEVLSFSQEVIYIYTHLCIYRLSIRIVAKFRTPEDEEMLTLFHTMPRIIGVLTKHKVCSLFKMRIS